MTFVSYAQNFEDVVLWRALHDVRDGRYLDIGAQEPEFDSVSLAFYRAGWRGIHVDPAPAYAAKLREARPDETVIEAAVTDAPGPIPFYELGGLSSGRPDIAQRHERDGHHPHRILVPTVRLDHLLELTEGDLHWLKIDVEGMETDVLRSWGECSKRPWILLIESTFPNSEETTDHLWIDQVSERGYEEVFFDGLSRYFVHESHKELEHRLNRPANVFDKFQVTSQHFSTAIIRAQSEELAKTSESRVAAISLDVLQLRDKFQARDSEANELAARLGVAASDLKVERLRSAQLEDLRSQFTEHLKTLEDQRALEQQARVQLNEELVSITRLVGSDPVERTAASAKGRWIDSGAAYAAVKARLEFARDELQTAREFGIQQFVGGQRSRDSEVTSLGDRISALQAELVRAANGAKEAEHRAEQDRANLQADLVRATNRVKEAEHRAEQDRADLHLRIEEQAVALTTIRSEAAELARQLFDTNEFLTSVYSKKAARFALWLRLLPRRSSSSTPVPWSQAAPAPVVDQRTAQTIGNAENSKMDIPVNDLRHTSNLLALNGSAFVEALYRTFLKRSPDRDGRDHYIARLRTGDSKERVLVAVASSPEAQGLSASVDGLAEIRRSQSRAGRFSFLRPGRRALDARLNKLEYSIGEAQNLLMERLDRMESSLDQILARLDNSGHGPVREAGVYVQGTPFSIKRGISIRPTNGAGEFIQQLRESVQSSAEALSLRNGR